MCKTGHLSAPTFQPSSLHIAAKRLFAAPLANAVHTAEIAVAMPTVAQHGAGLTSDTDTEHHAALPRRVEESAGLVSDHKLAGLRPAASVQLGRSGGRQGRRLVAPLRGGRGGSLRHQAAVQRRLARAARQCCHLAGRRTERRAICKTMGRNV